MVGILVAVVAVLVLGFCGCLGVGSTLLGRYAPEPVAEDPYDGYDDEVYPTWAPPAPSQPATPASTPSGGPGRYPVSYEVAGTGRADIQYYDANGDFIRLEGVRLPWRGKIRTDDPNRVVVTARGDESVAVRCSAQVGDRAPVTQTGEPGSRVTCQPS
ncbi:MmpS family transport accessory protein [Micromonospora sp. KC606]|uniref:MmpS family transport accessory protein n=1 Tax=Micromonospora sp. KC606 TaxID=2530379 RepID=UPI001404D726|nr:MmpS family transport accessory protein [Micromonospora sp. KC606]